jgi:hypothetical protein
MECLCVSSKHQKIQSMSTVHLKEVSKELMSLRVSVGVRNLSTLLSSYLFFNTSALRDSSKIDRAAMNILLASFLFAHLVPKFPECPHDDWVRTPTSEV